MCSRPGQRVKPRQRWFKQGQRCTNVKPGQALLNEGSRAIKPPLDDNVHSDMTLDQPGREAEGIYALVA